MICDFNEMFQKDMIDCGISINHLRWVAGHNCIYEVYVVLIILPLVYVTMNTTGHDESLTSLGKWFQFMFIIWKSYFWSFNTNMFQVLLCVWSRNMVQCGLKLNLVNQMYTWISHYIHWYIWGVYFGDCASLLFARN